MPSNTHKSAAVPFINQKGERSMKRVKVERYVAGKKPAYAKDEDDEEEYYTEEDDDDEDVQQQEGEDDDDDDDNWESVRAFRSGRSLEYSKPDDDDESSSSSDNETVQRASQVELEEAKSVAANAEEEEDDDDDPRFRRLKQIGSKRSGGHSFDPHRAQQIQPKQELKNVVLDEDDDEEEIRRRHASARQRQLEVSSARLEVTKQGDDIDDDDDSQDGTSTQPKRLDTDDLLKDLKLTGISRSVREKMKTADEEEAEKQKLLEMIEQAKNEASFTRQTNEKIDEDIKKEVEKEALAKGDIGAREMTAVNTDDDDEELAYEAWKLREYKRVVRDRSEKGLTRAR